MLFSVLHHDEGLFEVGDGLAIHVVHVLRNRDLLIIINELLRDWVGVEVDSRDPISALVAPISDDAGVDDLELYQFFELAVVSGVTFQVINLVKTSNGRHEAEEGVDSHSHTRLTHEDGGLVAVEHL